LRAIDIDAGESTTYTCTANKVVDCSFVKVAGAGSAFTDGIAVGARARGNCEFMQFHDCTFDGLDHSGILFPGGAAEPFDCEFAHCQFLNQPYGILGTGSGSWAGGVRQCSFESLSNYGLSTQSHHFVLVEACDSENCAYLVNAPSGQVAMIGGRYAPLGCSTAPGSEYVHVGSGGMLGVHFEATDVNCRITGMASTIGCVFSTVAPFTPNPYGGLPFAIGCSGATGNNQGYQSLARDVSPTVGGAGSASAPPANPAGYIVLELHQGGPVKVPYYNP
jgi:hypothetical protein